MAAARTGSGGGDHVGRRPYVLTLRTADEVPYFLDAATVRRTRALIREAASQTGFVLAAYCFLPDRLCLLVEGTSDTADLRRFVVLSKQRTGYRHKRLHARKLWRPGYAVRRLDRGEPVRLAARDLLLRPWQDGLVTDPREYPFLGSDVSSVDELLAGYASALRTRMV